LGYNFLSFLNFTSLLMARAKCALGVDDIIGIIFCDLISPDKSAVTKQAVAEAVDSKLKYFLL